MSTNFSEYESLPPKLKYKMAARSESANNSEGSSTVTKKSPPSTINDKSKEGPSGSKCKSTLMAKNNKKMKPSAPVMYKEESSKTASKTAAKRRTYSKRKAEADDDDDDDVGLDDTDWTNDIPFCPTYHPSKEEFEDPMAYISQISVEAVEYGMCKIVPPIGPSEQPSVVLKEETKAEKFKAELLPLHTKYRDIIYLSKSDYTIEAFEKEADEQYTTMYNGLAQLPPSIVEKDFWKTVAQKKDGTVAEYINGIEKSAFSVDPNDPLARSNWNLKKFAGLPQSALRLLEYNIKGVTDPLLYLGMLFSYIFWSTEPGHLYSIEYHHFGSPRTWYGSPSSAAYEFEEVVKKAVLPKRLQKFEAYDLLDFKTMLFSPNVMLKYKVPLFKTVQYPGEFIVTFPKAYHMAINHGFNCWEAARFTTPHWFPFGDDASERRALYKRPQIVPYQELLCKEAMHLYANKRSLLASQPYKNLKVNFASLIRLHHFAYDEIKRTGAQVRVAPYSDKIMFCKVCHRECYLAYVTCRCYSHPICIFHGIYKDKKCPCKASRVMSVREGILEMKNVARTFEAEDEDLLAQVKELVGIRGFQNFGLTPRMNLDSVLDELRNVSPPVTKKSRTKYI